MNFREINIGKFKLSADGSISANTNIEFSQLYLKCPFICIDGKLIQLDIQTNTLKLKSDFDYPKSNGHIYVKDYIQTDDFIIKATSTSIDLIPTKKFSKLEIRNHKLIYNNRVYECKDDLVVTNGLMEAEFVIWPEKNEIVKMQKKKLIIDDVVFNNGLYMLGNTPCFKDIYKLFNYIKVKTGNLVEYSSINIHYAMSEQMDEYYVYDENVDTYKYPLYTMKNISLSPPTKITYKIFGSYDTYDIFLVKQALVKWESVIQEIDLHVDLFFEDLGQYILGSAGPTNVVYKNNKWMSSSGKVSMNIRYWGNDKHTVRRDYCCNAYYTLLHEIGHVLGIGTLWVDNNLLDYGPWYSRQDWWNSNWNSGLYVGENALREYNKITGSEHEGILVENDGGPGTAGGHPEEHNRYHDGSNHVGFGAEIMSGWAEEEVVEPLSKITVGFLEDLGYNVNYENADVFIMA
jgi:hypothetical protein